MAYLLILGGDNSEQDSSKEKINKKLDNYDFENEKDRNLFCLCFILDATKKSIKKTINKKDKGKVVRNKGKDKDTRKDPSTRSVKREGDCQ
nr:hypothetical protein [Borreliella bissettiae]